MSAVIARILLRYGAATLVARGLLTDDAGSMLATDPDVQIMIGTGLGVATEAWYYLAHRFGWSK